MEEHVCGGHRVQEAGISVNGEMAYIDTTKLHELPAFYSQHFEQQRP